MSTRPQFGLRGIIIAVTLFAFYLALCVAPRDIKRTVAPILIVGLVTVAVTHILYGTGLLRAFWIGWMVPLALTWMERGFGYSLFDGPESFFLVMIAVCTVCGGIAWCTAWWLRTNPPAV